MHETLYMCVCVCVCVCSYPPMLFAAFLGLVTVMEESGEPDETEQEEEEEEEDEEEIQSLQQSPEPEILRGLPALSSLLKTKPSPLLAFNLVDILYPSPLLRVSHLHPFLCNHFFSPLTTDCMQLWLCVRVALLQWGAPSRGLRSCSPPP